MKLTKLQLVVLCIISIPAFSQLRPIQLQLQKNGHVKKRFELGTTLQVWGKSGKQYTGYISFMIADTLFLNGRDSVAIRDIRKIRIAQHKKKKAINWKEIGWVTLGVGISTAGMALSKMGNLANSSKEFGSSGLFRLRRAKNIRHFFQKKFLPDWGEIQASGMGS